MQITTDINTVDKIVGVTKLANGKILAGGTSSDNSNGEFTLLRYNADGTLDTTFDTDGKLTTDIGTASNDQATSMVVQADGKILLAGDNGNDFALVRYNTDGSLDTSFDTDGKLTTDFGSTENGYSMALQTDGKIIIAGGTFSGGGDFALARYNTDGSLDTTFDTDGKLTTEIGTAIGGAPTSDTAYAVAVQTDGKILAAGNKDGDFALVRYNTDGTLDTNFGGSGNGVAITDFSGDGSSMEVIKSIAVQADGKIVAAGYSGVSGEDFALARYNTDGTLDTSFDTDGMVTTDFGGAADEAYAVRLQADGKIVVVGTGKGAGTDNEFAVARYNTDGSLDTSFGTGGKLTTAITAGDDAANAVYIDAGGWMLAGGSSNGGGDFALASYTASGVQDNTAPTLSSSPTDGATTVAAGDNIVLTFNETVYAGAGNIRIVNDTDVSTTTIAVGDGQIGISGTTVTINPTSDLTVGKNYHIEFDSGAILDGAGNAYAGITTTTDLNFTVTPPPTIVIATDDNTLTVGEAATLTFTLSEPSSNFTAADISVAGGALSGFAAVNSTVYTATFTPTPNSTTSATVNVAGGSFTNATGNGNTAASQLSMTVDTIAPTIAIATNDSTLTVGETATLTFTLSEASSNFTAADISVAGGTLSAFTGSSTSYTATFTPTPNSTTSATVNVAGGSFTDAAGNGNTAASQLSMTVETLAPSLSSSSPTDGATTVTASGDIVLTFNEAVSAGSGNIVISDGAGDTRTIAVGDTSQVTISGTTVTINPTADLVLGSSYYVQIANTAFVDTAGNAYAGISDTTTLNFTTTSVNTAPAFGNLTGSAASFTEGGSAVVLDADVTITDAELTGSHYNGATLTLARSGGASSDDVFGATGNLSLNAGNVILSSTTIGSYTNTGGTLAITFNASAIQADVNETLQSITYSNSSDAPTAAATIGWTFNDGNTGTQGTGGELTATGSTILTLTGANDAPTGTVTIDGTAKAGQTLKAVTSTLADPDLPNGLGTLAYQWKAAGTNVGSNQSTYVATDADAGKTITVDVSYTDFDSSTRTVSSTATSTVSIEIQSDTGIATTDFGSTDNGRGVALQSDGKIVVSGGSGNTLAVARYNTDGSLDTSFDMDGMVKITGSSGAYSSVILQTDGKIIASAQSFIARLNSDGSLDTSFDSDGKIDSGPVDRFWDEALQADGKIVAVETYYVYRFNPDGSLDTTFDKDGKATGISSIYGVTLQSDGKIITLGGNFSRWGLTRYNSDGSLDTTFDKDGKVTTNFEHRDLIARNAVVLTDGKIVVAGRDGGNFAVARYNSDGSLDTTFDKDGKVSTKNDGADSLSGAWDVVVQSDGKIVTSGRNGASEYLMVIRYNTDGSLDTTFSGDGKAELKSITASRYADIELQTDGKLVVAGAVNENFAVARLNTDGSLDLSFGDKVGSTQAADTNTIAEDAGPLNVDSAHGVLTNDSGTGTKVATALNGSTITAGSFQTFDGSYGTLTLYSTGAYSYALDSSLAGVQSLKANATATDVFGYTMQDGSNAVGHGTLTITVTGVNDAPVANGVDDFTTVAGTAFEYQIASNAFKDVDSGDTLSYSVQQVDVNGDLIDTDGNGTGDGLLPAGLTFNASTRTFSGTADVAADNYWIKVTSTDSANATASTIFALEVKTAVVADNKGKFIGGDGDEIIAGSTGAQSMKGENGDDTYIVNDKKDKVTEDFDEGDDTVVASISYKLGKNVENLTLVGAAADNLSGVGNELDNVLIGDDGDNILDGGKGTDTFEGGQGDDTYILDDLVEQDLVTENEDEGTDTIKLAINVADPDVSFTLADYIENLTLTGKAVIDLIGNDLDNVITGNTKDNTLTGLSGDDTLDGGKGADTMDGGDGNDLYYVDTGDKFAKDGITVNKAGDTITEAADEGTDTVISSAASYILADNIETLILAKAGKGIGNDGDNSLIGSSKNDKLDGAAGDDTINGGLGKDVLSGGDGADIFVFDSALKGNVDTITDFSSTDSDKIELHAQDSLGQNLFFALQGLELAETNLAQGAGRKTALEADDYLIYDTNTGALYYDADGSGTADKAVQFATLTRIEGVAPTLAYSDFTVV